MMATAGYGPFARRLTQETESGMAVLRDGSYPLERVSGFRDSPARYWLCRFQRGAGCEDEKITPSMHAKWFRHHVVLRHFVRSLQRPQECDELLSLLGVELQTEFVAFNGSPRLVRRGESARC